MAYPVDTWNKSIELSRALNYPEGQKSWIFESLEDLEVKDETDNNTTILKERRRANNSAINNHSKILLTNEQEEDCETTLLFEDGVRKIDYILTYTNASKEFDKNHDEDDDHDKKTMRRNTFLDKFKEHGLEYEIQDCSKSYDQATYFVKVHGKWNALLENAERLKLRMPVEKSKLREVTWRERFFDFINVIDPLVPDIDFKYKIKHCLTAPFRKESNLRFIGIEDDETFFTSAQRSAIVFDILEHVHYGNEPDQVGISRLLSNHSFSKAFQLHDGPYYCKSADGIKSDRQLLYYHWSKWTNFYKSQPLDHVRRYFGEKIGIYFTWVGFYTEWLIYASFVGFVVMLYGYSSIPTHRNALADDICNSPREHFYMCPLCDERCDFWYYHDTCTAAHMLFLFDNGGTVFFAAFMSLWAVLFLEFWKRRQFVLQHDWDVLGYEKVEECPRPEFEHEIKRRIGKLEFKGKDSGKYKHYNSVYEKDDLVQPTFAYLSKIGVAFSMLCSMVLVVIGIVFAVLIYRLVVTGILYRRVQNLRGGPSAIEIIVLITGSVIQLIAILIMNKVYEFFAGKLTKWELHRTQSEFDDNFIAKMYVFQFVNFYSSIFYIAFLKGNFTGNPGNYYRIGSFRLDECSTYGCLLELTIQLSIVMIGKQMINNFIELGVPFVKWLMVWHSRKKQIGCTNISQWQKDFELPPISSHGLFSEYLELVIQFGFITIFVAAFPLAPLFALLNNIIEIRLDAFKFVTVLRRPVAERAQDIGTWFTILSIIAKLAVVTNAFLIAITAQFIPLLVYRYHDPNPELRMTSPAYMNDNLQKFFSGYVEYSLSKFPIRLLLEDDKNPFPLASAVTLKFYNETDEPTEYFYQPYHTSVDCFTNTSRFDIFNLTEDDFPFVILDNNHSRVERRPYFSETLWDKFTSLYMIDPGEQDRKRYLECVNQDYPCSFRGLATESGDFRKFYYITWTSRLAFIVCFEHVIFVVSSILASLVPDVPTPVQNEISREKLLAYEALHNKKN